jgi:hypothetical protein
MAMTVEQAPLETLRTPAPLSAVLTAEMLSAVLASLSVSPLVYIIDRSIVSNMSGRQKLVACVLAELGKLVTRPDKVLTSVGFRWIWTV